MHKFIIAILSLSIILASCNSDKKKLESQQAIKQAEQLLFSKDGSYKFDPKKAEKLIEQYSNYAKKYPKDSLTPEYLFKSAEMLIAAKKFEPANVVYEKIINEYPSYRKLPICIFMEGFNYENNLVDLVQAKKYYEQFLAKYPNDPMANDVKMSLEHLGMSADEIIKEFEAKNAK